LCSVRGLYQCISKHQQNQTNQQSHSQLSTNGSEDKDKLNPGQSNNTTNSSFGDTNLFGQHNLFPPSMTEQIRLAVSDLFIDINIRTKLDELENLNINSDNSNNSQNNDSNVIDDVTADASDVNAVSGENTLTQSTHFTPLGKISSNSLVSGNLENFSVQSINIDKGNRNAKSNKDLLVQQLDSMTDANTLEKVDNFQRKIQFLQTNHVVTTFISSDVLSQSKSSSISPIVSNVQGVTPCADSDIKLKSRYKRELKYSFREASSSSAAVCHILEQEINRHTQDKPCTNVKNVSSNVSTVHGKSTNRATPNSNVKSSLHANATTDSKTVSTSINVINSIHSEHFVSINDVANNPSSSSLSSSSSLLSLNSSSVLESPIRPRHNLIIMASLVDKLPNVAGLVRTAEVFQCEKVCLHSLAVIKTDAFKSAAVSAEKWMPLQEVADNNIRPYLAGMKRKGYTIIALEQSANSVSMQDYKFPDKCVLVLGREVQGVPSDILSDVDVCLEIPQFGKIRSLNVAVSASMTMWQYVAQSINRSARLSTNQE
jgi:tRNA G18 (ribose-2'-O)-methylase SpoU